jgi:hypothetical protein
MNSPAAEAAPTATMAVRRQSDYRDGRFEAGCSISVAMPKPTLWKSCFRSTALLGEKPVASVALQGGRTPRADAQLHLADAYAATTE